MANKHGGNTIVEILGAIFDMLREGIADVRKEVVERGWFGRVTEGIASGGRDSAASPLRVEMKIGSMHNEFALVKVNEVTSPAARNWDGLRKELAQERSIAAPELAPDREKDKEHGLDR